MANFGSDMGASTNAGGSSCSNDSSSIVPVDGPAGAEAKLTVRKKTPNDFKFMKIIGEGSFSTVFFGKEVATGREYAIKVCEKRQIQKEKKQKHVTRERDAMKILNQTSCPFFVRLYCTFQDEDRLYFVMTWAEHGELLGFLRKLGSFNKDVTRFYSAELIFALEHLHSLGIIHRDLKPENVLLSGDMHIKISDFGSAKLLRDDPDRPTPLLPNAQRRNSFEGTAQYVSPEVLVSSVCTPSADLWALGCIVYQMLSGLPPFRDRSEYLIFQKILSLDYTFPDGFDPLVKQLVQQLLVLNAEDRLGARNTGGYEALRSHPFFEEIEWEKLPQTKPPDIKPFLPATSENEELTSNYKVPDHVEPGLDDKQLTRLLGLDLADLKLTPVNRHALDNTPEQRREKLAAQARNTPYNRFVEGNLIIKSGLVDKRRGLFARTRMFLLTEGPHIYYVDPANMSLKGQIPWSKEMRVEAKNFRTFFVHTPNRTYYLIDHTGHSLAWCEAIEQVRQYYYCTDSKGNNLLEHGSSGGRELTNQSPVRSGKTPGKTK